MGTGLKDRLNKIKIPPVNESRVWSNGVISSNPTQIESINFVLHYGGPAVWEGIRSYLQSDGSTKIFKLEQHMHRLLESAKILNMEIPYTVEELVEGAQQLVESCGGGDLYLRPIAYTTQPAKSVRTDQTYPINVDIYAFPFDVTQKKSSFNVRVSSSVRGYPQFQMQAKTTANYHFLNTCKHEFVGVDDILFCDNEGYVVEGSVSNIFMVKNGYLITPPQEGSLLSGVTRQWIGQQKNELPVNGIFEKRITKPDLYTADEIFLCGTYMEITPVTIVDGRKVGSGQPGRVTKTLMTVFNKATRG